MSASITSHNSPADISNPLQTNGKRKRLASPEDGKGPVGNSDIQEKQGLDQFYGLLKDILVILRSHDTKPSILDCPIDSTIEQDHSAKRTKLTDPATKITIASRIESNAYGAIEELVADVYKAVANRTSDLSDKKDPNDGQALPKHSHQNHADVTRARALQKELDTIILRERIQRPQLLRAGTKDSLHLPDKEFTEEKKVNGARSSIGGSSVGGTVLTLFGGAPQPKQLFSSLQQPISIMSEQAQEKSIVGRLNGYKSSPMYAPLKEFSLPNGISTTRIVPIHSTSSTPGKKGVSTIGELFAPPPTLAPLNPPRQSRHTATRSSSVNWFNASEAPSSSKSHRKESYTTQPLTTPQWLTYNVAPSPKELSSPEAKRKQRDRALSIGETQSTLSQEAIADHQQAKEDALFRSVYSSFAPDRDNATALVSERTKNQMWWKRVGESKYQELSTFGSTEAVPSDANGTAGGDETDEDILFEEAVDDWAPEDPPIEMKEPVDHSTEIPETTKEVEEILQGVSELLETLNSYQRVRNLSLSSTTRAINGQNPQSTTTSGSPTSPSDAESDVYEMLKSQLAIMVQMLPPYALAKLNGEKLGVLNINTKLQIEGKNYKGTMEEDDPTTKTRLAANTGYTARSLNANTSLPARSTGYHPTTTPVPASRSSYASQATAPRPATGSAAYLPNQQYSSRPASANHYFSGNSRSSFTPQRPAVSASERYSYSASQHYSPQPPPSSHSQYTNGSRPYSTTNGSSYSQQYSIPQPAGSTIPAQGSQQRPSQPGYQQRAMNSQGYGYTAAGPGRSASPPKATSAYTPPQPSQPPQQQPSTYPTYGSTPSQQRPQLYHQHSSQYGGQTSTPTHTNGAIAAGSDEQKTYMTANEQAMLMNRQKVQLAEQQSTSIGQGTATPQPMNGLHSGQQSGTAGVQQNGIMAGQGQ